jgi:hypothetical protein
MSLDRSMEIVEEQLLEDYADGIYSLDEFNERMRDLGREYRDAVEEEAQEAYDDVKYRRGGYG